MTAEAQEVTDYFDDIQQDAITLDLARRHWATATEDERRSAFEMFCSIEDCYPQSWMANENFYLYLRYQPLQAWRRHRPETAAA